MKTFEKGQWLYAKIGNTERLLRFSSHAPGETHYSEGYYFDGAEFKDLKDYYSEYPHLMGFDNNSPIGKSVTPATEEQRNEMLLRVAAAKGFKPGVKFKMFNDEHTISEEGICMGSTFTSTIFRRDSEEINGVRGIIYDEKTSRWATIIKDEAEGEESVSDFLDQAIKDLDEDITKEEADLKREAQDAADLKEFTKAAMQGLIQNWTGFDLTNEGTQKLLAKTAFSIANYTLSELKKG